MWSVEVMPSFIGNKPFVFEGKTEEGLFKQITGGSFKKFCKDISKLISEVKSFNNPYLDYEMVEEIKRTTLNLLETNKSLWYIEAKGNILFISKNSRTEKEFLYELLKNKLFYYSLGWTYPKMNGEILGGSDIIVLKHLKPVKDEKEL